MIATKWIQKVARLIADKRYADALSQAQAGMAALEFEIEGLRMRQQELRELSVAAKILLQENMSPVLTALGYGEDASV